MAQDFYLRIPVPGGDAYEYVRVDSARITRELITQLYTRERSRQGPPRYFAVSGSGHTNTDHMDLGPLLESVHDLLLSYTPGFQELGPVGEETLQTLSEGLTFERLFASLERGEITIAKREWEGILHALLAGTLSLASRLQATDNHASSVSVGIEQISATFEENEAARLRIYDAVIEGSLLLLHTTARLDTIEEGLSALEQEVDGTISRWQEQLSADSEPYASARTFFGGSDGDVGFNLQAFQFNRNPSLYEGDEPDTILAQLHLEECQETLTRIQEEWRLLQERVHREVFPIRATIAELCADLGKGSRAIREYRRAFGATHQPPFELDAFRERITPEQFKAGGELADDHRWGPSTTKSRLDSLCSRMIARLEKPVLPSAVERLLDQAGRFLTQMQTVADSPAGDSTQRVSSPSPESPASHSTESDSDVGRPEAIVDPRRAQEIYELVKCVGFVLTCNHHHLAATTIRAMLDVLRFMGRVSLEEVELYRRELYKLSRASGERVHTDDGKRVSTLRKSSQATWIAFETRKQKRLKMTVQGGKRTEALLARHQLTTEQIKAAHEGRRAEQEELHRSRKA
ncbi:hypothetical protein COV05_02320 [Candidatus Uhrbacteria bacterium CG10_big_fil_rev_8_21_14_0_10_48_16]|uniref:Uncharacterized protein n=1 Tax=Candidatus Uhrbacteria bacterium CG10_big_fil_rev_8_21_14_0_10_48_16 TaxID=1975038 RepID=A0A2M8LHB3_9BACT|nr:MAG: hypothetical protein COV05_02320 [Candidatus Uhrbacteria bacterium CG10_big_fil_rev_8_21_14_0_10_48_16]